MRHGKLRYHFEFAALAVLVGACASDQAPPPVEEILTEPLLANEANQPATLGHVVRKAGSDLPPGLVLMNGLEALPLKSPGFRGRLTEREIERIASDSGLRVAPRDQYRFLYDPEYEVLLGSRLDWSPSPAYRDIRQTVRIGAGTPLFTVFALLSQSSGKTIVADNAVAGSAAGEIALDDTPVAAALEAVLVSARIPPDAVRIVEYEANVFLASVKNRATPPFLINGANLSVRQREALDARVSRLTLPSAQPVSGSIEAYTGAVRLSRVLPELSRQLGMTIRASQETAAIPINPVVMNGLTRQAALDLIVWQWPINEFGYEMQGGEVVFKRRPSAPQPQSEARSQRPAR